MKNQFNKNKINICLNCAALGDTICAMPIIKNLLAENRINGILSNSKWIELMELYGIPSEMITFMREDGTLTPFDDKGFLIAPFYLEHRAPYRVHLIDFFSYSVSYSILKSKEKSIKIDPSRLPVNPIKSSGYVVMQGSTRLRSRTMPKSCWESIRDGILRLGLDVVVLGDPKDSSDYDLSKCNAEYMGCGLGVSAAICAGARCVVGVDGGLIYIAATTDVPIVAGYTFVDPYYRAPWRDGVFAKNFSAVGPRGDCKYCTNSLCAYGIEFDKACPNDIDFDCMKTLHPDDFMLAILSYCQPQD